jgi:hypothetical protein
LIKLTITVVAAFTNAHFKIRRFAMSDLHQDAHLVIVSDCARLDEARYKIAARTTFLPHRVQVDFFETEPMNPFHSGFVAAAHVLSTFDLFDAPREGQRIGVLVNSAPRHGTENQKLRGTGRTVSGEEIYALLLRNGIWVVGPNAGPNLFFLEQAVKESYLVEDTSGMETPFRSMQIMVPALAKLVVGNEFPNIKLIPKQLVTENPGNGPFIADVDSFGNIYIYDKDDAWVPSLGGKVSIRVGNYPARPQHVGGIFAGETGDQTLTKGSLKLFERPIYYIVVVGGSAHRQLGSPQVGTKITIE